MFKHILVPTDGSEFSMNTVRRAVTFAREAGARITAFNAKPAYAITEFGGEGALAYTKSIDEYEQYAEEQAQKVLGDVERLCKEAGVECSKMTLTSNLVYEAIIEAAMTSGCDLIFMASHGRSGLGALLLGSETNKVLTHSKVPVLVYR